MTAKSIYNYLNKVYDFNNQEKWDKSVLHLHSDAEIENILICLDINQSVLKTALENNVELIISHHPLFVEPPKLDNFHTRKILGKLKNSNISVITLHTPFDKSMFGMNTAIAYKLGLSQIKFADDKMTVIGDLKSSVKLSTFAEFVKHVTNSDYAAYLSRYENDVIEKVAICAGSASSNMFNLVNEKFDVFITCDMKHHAWVDSIELDIPIISLNHNIENIFIDILYDRLVEIVPECKFFKMKSAIKMTYLT